MFAASVQSNGDITAGGTTLVHNGIYMGDANWGANVTNLKTPPTSVTRYELCVGGWGDGSWGNMQSIVNSQGAYGILKTNFQALKNACPGLDAINDDDEGNYDINSATQVGQMLGSIGLKLSQVPYTNQGFWVQLRNNLGSGICDIIYLQCYQGGAGNDPAQWNAAYGNGVHVVPGEETNYASQSQFTTWASSSGATGGFFWPDWYWCPGTNWPTQIAAGIGTNCSLPGVTPYLQVNGASWQNTNNATVPYAANVNLGPQDSGEAWSWTGPNGFTATSREIDNIPLQVGTNTFVVTNTTSCVCNQTSTFTITMQPPPACSNGGTFGNTAAGTTGYNQAGILNCCSSTLSQGMTVTSISLYLGSGSSGSGVVGIYSDNAGKPGTLLAQSNDIGLVSGWNTATLAPIYLPVGSYWLTASFAGTANFEFTSDPGGMLWQNYTYTGSLPGTVTGSLTGYGWHMSIYASGCLAPVPTPTFTVPPCTTSSSTLGNTSTASAGSAGAGGNIGGTYYSLSQPMTVTALNFYFSSGTSGNGVVGLYSDEGGKPNLLLAQSNAQNVNPGANSFVVTPTVIPAGNYWLFGSFTGTVNWQYSSGCCAGGYLWGAYTYNSSLPTTLASSGLTGYGWTMCAYASGCLQPTPTNTPVPTALVCSATAVVCAQSDNSNQLWYNCQAPTSAPPTDGSGNAWNGANYNSASVSDWYYASTMAPNGAWAAPCSVAGSGKTPNWIYINNNGANADACGLTAANTIEYSYYLKTFNVPAGSMVTGAQISVAADNAVSIWVNGNNVPAASVVYASCTSITIPAGDFRAGSNQVAIQLINGVAGSGGSPGPGGLVYQLAYTLQGFTCTPTPTMTNTMTYTPTQTVTRTFSSTPSPTFTSSPTATSTFSASPTSTTAFTSTFTPSATKTSTASPTATYTNSNTATATSTNSSTPTGTFTTTSTITSSFTPTNTPSGTATVVNTSTATSTHSTTPTATVTNSFTPTSTPSLTNTATFTNTVQNTATKTPPLTQPRIRLLQPLRRALPRLTRERALQRLPRLIALRPPRHAHRLPHGPIHLRLLRPLPIR